MKKCFFIIVLFVNLFLIISYAHGTTSKMPLALEIELSGKRIKAGDDIIVNVKVVNVSMGYVVFYDRFHLEKIESHGSIPTAHLRFYADHGEGFDEIKYIGPLEFKLLPPDPNSFLILPPQYFLGKRIIMNNYLNVYRHKGKYSIKAVYENRSLNYIKKLIDDGYLSAEDLEYDINRVFNGVIESNIITIKIH